MAAARDRRDRDHQPAGGGGHTFPHDRHRLRGVWFVLIQPEGLPPDGHEPGPWSWTDPRSPEKRSVTFRFSTGGADRRRPPAAHRCRADASGPDRGAAAQGLGRRYPGEQVRAPSRTFRKPGSAPRRRGRGSPFAFTRLRIVLAPDPGPGDKSDRLRGVGQALIASRTRAGGANRRTDPVVMALATPGRHLRAADP
jgi:hypothetical protein